MCRIQCAKKNHLLCFNSGIWNWGPGQLCVCTETTSWLSLKIAMAEDFQRAWKLGRSGVVSLLGVVQLHAQGAARGGFEMTERRRRGRGSAITPTAHGTILFIAGVRGRSFVYRLICASIISALRRRVPFDLGPLVLKPNLNSTGRHSELLSKLLTNLLTGHLFGFEYLF